MTEKIDRPIHKRLLECLGHVISFRRKRLGMTQAELAEDSGVDRAFISNIEGGKRNPSFGLVASIAHALRMSYARLVHNCEDCAQEQQAQKKTS